MHTRRFHRLRSGSTPVWPMLLLLGAASLAGCAEQARVTSERQDSAPRNQSFSRVLVVGVSPDVNQRCAFEFFMASRIKSDSVTAITSCSAVAQKDPLTLESIELAVASVQADAVLATHLVAGSTGAVEGGGRDTRGGGYYKATGSGYENYYYGGYGVYGVPVIYGDFQTAPPVTSITGEAHVATKLYETRGKTLVYTVDTKVKNLESRDASLAAFAESIADRLRREKLIR